MSFNITYFLNGLTTAAIAAISIYISYLYFKKKSDTLAKIIGANGLFYLIPAFLSFAWSFALLSPQKDDFIFVEGSFNVIKTTGR